ncbi:MAG: CPBP family intramembrane metalloprotease [Gammaproteobacteria bacterium]|jgi:hypothetical protein|nr:CPBP family intramembrane metalloprotease [Gammaproteobacteria bacterium]
MSVIQGSMRLKCAALLVCLALPGVVAMAWLALPRLVAARTLPVSLETLQLATALQNAVLVLAATMVGLWTAPKVGLSSPVVLALVGGGRVREALRAGAVPALLGGCGGALVILGFHAFAPAALVDALAETRLPLVVRVLYGGLTEEVLLRWGLMSAIAWAAWRLCQPRAPGPSVAVLWTAIILSGLMFGLSHLPAVAHALQPMPMSVVVYVTFGNTLFGLIAGYLFWRHGLEAAMGAHVLAHVLAYLAQA